MSSPASIISILGPILAGILNLRRFWARCSTISWNIVPTIHVFKYVFMEETHKVSFTRVSLHFSCVVFTSILLHTVWCSVKSSSRRLRYVRFYWNGTFHCITHLVHSHYKPTYFTSSFTKMWHSISLFLKATSVYVPKKAKMILIYCKWKGGKGLSVQKCFMHFLTMSNSRNKNSFQFPTLQRKWAKKTLCV